MSVWADDRCADLRETFRARAAPASRPRRPSPRTAPARGSTRERAAKRLRALDHVLLAYVGADGYPEIVPVEVEDAGPEGIRLSSERRLPPGGRRAGLLAHSYRAQLIGLAARQHTGLADGRRRAAPCTRRTPSPGSAPRRTRPLLLLANGLLAKRGLRQARASRAGRCDRRRGLARPGLPAPENLRAEPDPGPEQYGAINAVYAALFAGLLVATRGRTPTPSASRAPSCCR